MSAFDSSTRIATFAADASQTSLEMPHMTTGQRKLTKKLLEEYPELRCESYGFGAERCLHLFKENHADVKAKTQNSPSPLSISCFKMKNTFIEDVATSEHEPIIVRSLQAHSEEANTFVEIASVLKLPVQKKVGVECVGEAIPKSARECNSSSDTHPELILPLTLENLQDRNTFIQQVRNTFIHIADVSADERVVQSMPHGMFKQCLLSEAAEACPGTFFCDTPTSAGGDTPCFSDSDADADQYGQPRPVTVGALVLVEGLVKLPAYNGRSAVVEAWDEATGRYSILIAGPGGCLQAKVKSENLRMISPCPR